MVIESKLLPKSIAAITFWPFVFIKPDMPRHTKLKILLHESVHLRQQKRWFVYGLGVGLLVWYFLYLFVLPVGWNPWRYEWEREAMEAQGLAPSKIMAAFKRPPYYLWLM